MMFKSNRCACGEYASWRPIEPTSMRLTTKTWAQKKNQYPKSDKTLLIMNPTVNQETNNVIFDIRDKVDKSKVIIEIFVAMIGLYIAFEWVVWKFQGSLNTIYGNTL